MIYGSRIFEASIRVLSVMIDAVKDPEGYARYMKERQEKRKLERLQQRLQEENQVQSKSAKLSDSKDFKVGLKVVLEICRCKQSRTGRSRFGGIRGSADTC